MKTFRIIFLAAALLCAGALRAQNFNPSGTTAADLLNKPASEEAVTAEGDINKDGIQDLVIAARGQNGGDNVAFYLGDGQGGYRIFRSYDIFFSGEKTGITINDKGVVRFQNDLPQGDADIFLFRYEKDDLKLIGGKEDRHQTGHYDISYNYLTGKMIRTDGEGKARKSTTLQMPDQPQIRFGWIPLCYDMLKYLVLEDENGDGQLSPEDMKVMGIFRSMQAGDMLFWHFCDYQNPYHDPRGKNGSWHADDEHLSPGSYNMFSSLNITLREDGSYLLEESTQYEDRSYEQQFNEDLSNMDEVMEKADIRESTTKTVWTFKDGRFTLISSESKELVNGEEVKEEATASGE
ncbi:MAG: FG-GAP repeat protein [Bacteroidales bacterium]|nr:FG-GAP repeat protein [Bacteroidales bacterium]